MPLFSDAIFSYTTFEIKRKESIHSMGPNIHISHLPYLICYIYYATVICWRVLIPEIMVEMRLRGFSWKP